MAGRASRREGFRAGIGGEMSSEFLGTFMLVLLGCGSVAVAIAGLPGSERQADAFGPANWLIIAFGWGFGVVFGIHIAGGVSGAHINPAVTLAFAARRRFPWWKVVPYMFAQVVGGFIAAALVYAVYSSAIDAFNAESHVGRSESLDTFAIFATFPAKYFGASWWGPLLDQVVGTGILVLLIFALLDLRNQAPASNLGPFLIGMVVLAIGLSFGTNAGYAINPARDLGPRLWTFLSGWGDIAFPGTYQWFSNYFWIPIVGPLLGGLAGAVVYDLFVGQVLSARSAPAEVGRVSPPDTE